MVDRFVHVEELRGELLSSIVIDPGSNKFLVK